MSDQTNMPTHQLLLTSVRSLLAIVEQPLSALAETLQMPEKLLTELEPVLAVVDFLPFAQVTVNAAETHQPAPKPPLRPTNVPPIASALTTAADHSSHTALLSSATQPGAAPQTILMDDPTKAAPPVFSLPNQKRGATGSASSTAPSATSPDHSLAQLVTTQATPLTGSAVGSANRNSPLAEQRQGEQASMSAVAQLSAEQTLQPGSLSAAREAVIIASSLTTMPLLAAVVDSLLAAPTARVEPVASQRASATGELPVPRAPVEPPYDGLSWPVSPGTDVRSLRSTNDSRMLSNNLSPLTTPSLGVPADDQAPMLTSWPTVASENQRTNGVGLGITSQAPLDAWTLAQLINDVLAEEARRHGVDLS